MFPFCPFDSPNFYFEQSFLFVYFLVIFNKKFFYFLSILMVIISLELTRVNPDRNIFSINVELTSTFLLYTGLVHHHHRILKRHIQRDICSYTTRWEYAKSCTGIFVTSTTCKKTTFFTRDKTSRSWKVALSRLQHKEGL